MGKGYSERPTELSEDQKNRINSLLPSDIEEIDEQLLKNVGHKWRKVAMVVGLTMTDFNKKYSGIPDLFFAQRVKELVNTGLLRSQGNLEHMRFSEVKKP